jgi:hypothetical protein
MIVSAAFASLGLFGFLNGEISVWSICRLIIITAISVGLWRLNKWAYALVMGVFLVVVLVLPIAMLTPYYFLESQVYSMTLFLAGNVGLLFACIVLLLILYRERESFGFTKKKDG